VAIWSICDYFVYLVAIWYILWLFGQFFPRFGMLYQEKSGNPAPELLPLNAMIDFWGAYVHAKAGCPPNQLMAIRITETTPRTCQEELSTSGRRRKNHF
jgi:hypothetical protein